jgi:cytochrome c oxidase assembly factor CtaG
VSAPSLPSLLVTQWQPSVVPLLGAGAACGLYVVGVRRLRRRWPVRRTLSFLAAAAVIVLALCSGLERFDDRLLSAHMVEHMLLLLIAPALAVIGRPVTLALRALPPGARPRLARGVRRAGALAGPLPCLVVFAVVVVATHLPPFYSAALRHPILHDLEHALYLLAGGLLWWPILDGEPAPTRRLSGLGRLILIIAAMVPMALVGAYLNRHVTLVYASYGPPAREMGISAVADQQQAGAIMWVLGDLVMVAAGLSAAMSAMVAEERRQQGRERHAARQAGELAR